MIGRLSGLSFLLAVCLFSGQHGPVHQVARVLGAVADLGEATSAAAVQAINATNALASSATALVSVATSNGLTAGANLWRGIDLADLRASRCAGSVTAINADFLALWLSTATAQAHFPCLTSNLTSRLIAAARAVDPSLPYTQAISEDLSLDGHFVSVRVAATWHDVHRISVHFDGNFLFFEPIWSNPLWTQWGFSLDAERDQILKSLRMLLLELPTAAAQRAFAGIDLEVAISDPVLTQQVLLAQFAAALWRRFQGGFGGVDALVHSGGLLLQEHGPLSMLLMTAASIVVGLVTGGVLLLEDITWPCPEGPVSS